MGARYQSPDTGRFISQDPIFLLTGASNFSDRWNRNWRDIKAEQSSSQFNQNGKDSEDRLALMEYLSDPQGLNSYSYVKNNPLKYTDPNGEFAFLLAIPAAEFVIPAVIAGVATIGAIAVNRFAKDRPLQWDPGRFQLPRIHNQESPDETNLFRNGPPENIPGWKKAVIGASLASAAVKEFLEPIKQAKEFIVNFVKQSIESNKDTVMDK